MDYPWKMRSILTYPQRIPPFKTSRIMKAFDKRLIATTLILATLLVFQSCVIYHKTPSTLEKASQEQLRTKVKTGENKTYKFRYITYDNGVFYGINERSGKPVKTSLYNENVTGVYLMNEYATILSTIGVIVAVPLSGFLLLLAFY